MRWRRRGNGGRRADGVRVSTLPCATLSGIAGLYCRACRKGSGIGAHRTLATAALSRSACAAAKSKAAHFHAACWRLLGGSRLAPASAAKRQQRRSWLRRMAAQPQRAAHARQHQATWRKRHPAARWRGAYRGSGFTAASQANGQAVKSDVEGSEEAWAWRAAWQKRARAARVRSARGMTTLAQRSCLAAAAHALACGAAWRNGGAAAARHILLPCASASARETISIGGDGFGEMNAAQR